MPKITSVDKLIEQLDKLFSIRPRSEKEVRDYFRAKNYKLKIKNKEQISDSLIDLVIQKLKKQNILNDLEFAKAWMESKSKKYGVNRIKQELYRKGIERDIIGEIILKQSTGSSGQVAYQALEKKWKIWQHSPFLEKKKKSYEFLIRRGFEYDVVKNVVEKFLQKE